MGDVAMLPHALRALKEAYPEVKVTVATKSLFHPFFEGVDVDFLDIETRRTHRGIRGAIRFAREAAELKIDAPTAKQKGLIMKNLMPRVKGKADSALVNQVLTAKMQN